MQTVKWKDAKAAGLKTYFTGKPCPKGHVSLRRISGACVDCSAKLSAEWQKTKPGRTSKDAAKWRKKNPERNAALKRAWRLANPGRAKASAAKRKAAIKRAAPKWVDWEAIAAIYQEAAEKGLSVDHVIPLQGANVCGLHVAGNLQLLTLAANRAKSNKFQSG